MAEILLKIKDGGGYEDGDVLCAFNRRRIRFCHAEHICHPWAAGRNGDGWRPADSLAHDLHANCHQYRFRRVSQYEVERLEMATAEIVILSKTPNAKGEAIDVVEYLRRRKRSAAADGGPKKAVFGADGAEVWYGGRIDTSDAVLDKVWLKIAEKTGRLESEEEFQFWPMGRLDIRHHLAVRTTDFSDLEAEMFVRPFRDLNQDGEEQFDDDGKMKTKGKRAIAVDWRVNLLDDLKVTKAQVLDRNCAVGRNIVLPINKVIHRSKEQPKQADPRKLHDKEIGGPSTWQR